jgi:prepilin-type N-terminal cleavage/methylation domain-containing protein
VRAVKGFSLVELLVSMVLLSILVMLSTYSYLQFSRYWDGRLGNFDQAFSRLRNGWLLDDVLRNVHPYVVKNSETIPKFYFEGNLNGFVAVSVESLSEVDTVAVVRLSLIQNADLTFDLIYEEAPMKFATLGQLTEQPNFLPPVTLLSDLNNAQFNYYGAQKPKNDTEAIDSTEVNEWTNAYNSAFTGYHPKKVSLRWVDDSGSVSWVVDLAQPANGQLTTMMPEGFDV